MEKELKVTPGKWKVDPKHNLYIVSNNETICKVYADGKSSEEFEANRSLMAASKDLANALYECRTALILASMIDKSCTCSDAVEVAESALRKAGIMMQKENKL